MIFEIGLPRRTFTNKADAVKFINKSNGLKKAVYKTVYNFTEMNGTKPNYNSAIIDKLFFDFDKENCYDEAIKLHKFLLSENIKHYLILSGRGYHVFIKTIIYIPNNSKPTIYNAQHYFMDKLNLDCDTQIIGDNARLHRVPNTYHINAKRFCIPLTKEQFYLGDKKIKELAEKQNFVTNICIGNNLFDISKFDYESEKYSDFEIEGDVGISINDDYLQSCPGYIKQLLSNGDLKWKERYILILYFKERGFTIDEVLNILKKYLTERKFKHCVYEERQLQYLFERDDLVFPEQNGVKVYR